MAKNNLFHQFEVAGGVLAPGADEVGGEGVAFVDVAADVANPALLAFLCRRDACAPSGFRLDVLLVIVIGDAGAVGEDLGLHHAGDEQGVGAQVDALGDNATNHAVDEFGQVEQAVVGAQLLLAFGEFVDIPAALETEVLERLHGGLLAERTEIELQRPQHHVVREVGLVDADGNLQRIAGDLLRHVDDAGVVFLALTGNKDEEAVADIENGFVVNHISLLLCGVREE